MKKNLVVASISAVAVSAIAASNALAVPLVDYTATVTTLTSDLTTTILAAVGVGVLVLGAKLGWRFFKQFVK